MPRALSGGLLDHLNSGSTTLSACFRIDRRDGATIAFTNADVEIVHEGILYKPVRSASRSAVESSSDMRINNIELIGVVDVDEITENDIRGGLYDGAAVKYFLINYEDTTQGVIHMLVGTIGRIVLRDGLWVAEMRSLMQFLQKRLLRTYGPSCDADLGDARCGFDLNSVINSGSVTSIVTPRNSYTTSLGAISVTTFRFGKIIWKTGLNAGLQSQVFSVSGSTISIIFDTVKDIQVGDTFDMFPGCDKTPVTCQGTYGNIVRFRGFPFIPHPDIALRYPDAR